MKGCYVPISNNTRIYVVETGNPYGIPLLFIHAWHLSIKVMLEKTSVFSLKERSPNHYNGPPRSWVVR